MRSLLFLLAACSSGAPETLGCVDSADCVGVALCNASSECETVECLGSEQCPLDSFCDESTHACAPGCQTDDDCLSGFACSDAATCEPSACADSQLDCYFGEVCNVDVGICEPDDALCSSCSGADYTTCTEDIGGRCRRFESGQHCLPPCSPFTESAKTPRGFQCTDFDDSADGEAYFLFGDCADVVDRRTDTEADTE